MGCRGIVPWPGYWTRAIHPNLLAFFASCTDLLDLHMQLPHLRIMEQIYALPTPLYSMPCFPSALRTLSLDCRGCTRSVDLLRHFISEPIPTRVERLLIRGYSYRNGRLSCIDRRSCGATPFKPFLEAKYLEFVDCLLQPDVHGSCLDTPFPRYFNQWLWLCAVSGRYPSRLCLQDTYIDHLREFEFFKIIGPHLEYLKTDLPLEVFEASVCLIALLPSLTDTVPLGLTRKI